VTVVRPTFSSPSQGQANNPPPELEQSGGHRVFLQNFVAFNLNIAQAFYTHPKILVVGLNGPVVGLSAALISLADFIYAAPHTFLLTPFSSLGLVTEGVASRALVQRLGLAKANEALIMSRRISCEELVASGFVNKVFAECGGPGEDGKFRALVLKEIEERLGEHLVGESLLGIKRLIRQPEREVMDRQNVAEVFGGLERFMSGVPQAEFAKIASGKKRHKL
jgi:peroxisomal 3,2-trans-enoyl-CoA isomerase